MRKFLAVGLLCATIIPFVAAQSTITFDNDKVIQLSKIGLDDDIIISKIHTSSWKFNLQDDDLLALKKSGVSSKVIAAMLDSSVLTSSQVTIDGHAAQMHTLGQAKVGGRLGSALTYGIKSVKQKAFLPDPHSKLLATKSPAIMIEIPKEDTIDNYILVELDKKDDRRELEVGSVGGLVGAKTGVRAESIRKTTAKSEGGNKYLLSTVEPLKSGEYIVYVVGSIDKIKEIYGRGYDFTVE